MAHTSNLMQHDFDPQGVRGGDHSHRLDSHRYDQPQSISGQSGSEAPLKYDQQWVTVWLEHDLGMLMHSLRSTTKYQLTNG